MLWVGGSGSRHWAFGLYCSPVGCQSKSPVDQAATDRMTACRALVAFNGSYLIIGVCPSVGWPSGNDVGPYGWDQCTCRADSLHGKEYREVTDSRRLPADAVRQIWFDGYTRPGPGCCQTTAAACDFMLVHWTRLYAWRDDGYKRCLGCVLYYSRIGRSGQRYTAGTCRQQMSLCTLPTQPYWQTAVVKNLFSIALLYQDRYWISTVNSVQSDAQMFNYSKCSLGMLFLCLSTQINLPCV